MPVMALYLSHKAESRDPSAGRVRHKDLVGGHGGRASRYAAKARRAIRGSGTDRCLFLCHDGTPLSRCAPRASGRKFNVNGVGDTATRA